jgi:hypothetical protein
MPKFTGQAGLAIGPADREQTGLVNNRVFYIKYEAKLVKMIEYWTVLYCKK